MGADGAFITGSRVLVDGGVTASSFYGELAQALRLQQARPPYNFGGSGRRGRASTLQSDPSPPPVHVPSFGHADAWRRNDRVERPWGGEGLSDRSP